MARFIKLAIAPMLVLAALAFGGAKEASAQGFGMSFGVGPGGYYSSYYGAYRPPVYLYRTFPTPYASFVPRSYSTFYPSYGYGYRRSYYGAVPGYGVGVVPGYGCY